MNFQKRSIFFFIGPLAYLILLTSLIQSCSKSETNFDHNSSLVCLGGKNKLELVSLSNTPDGGFVLGANSWKNGNKDFLIVKYNDRLKVEWERLIGEGADETLKKVYVDKYGNILACGLSDGIAQDSIPLSSIKDLTHYFHFLDAYGNTLWSKPIWFDTLDYAFGWTDNEDKISFTDILEDEDDNFVITGLMAYTYRTPPSTIRGGFSSMLMRLSKSGKVKSRYVIEINHNSSFDQNFIAVFEQNSKYSVLWNWSGFRVGCFNVLKSDTGGYIPYQTVIDNSTKNLWNWPFELDIPDLVTSFKTSANPPFTYTYVLKNKLYRYEIDAVSNAVAGVSLPFDYGQIISATSTHDGNLMVANSEGIVFETSQDLKILNQFKTDFKASGLCKTRSGTYIIASGNGTQIYLTRYNAKGDL
ncbi:MAG: hypothetical protein H6605_05785 [Flavobacteriales bacterium]|nr:hypothetical protein [Flavobacteriales bacterium]